MASTLTVTNTINWAEPFTRFLPLNIGVGNEPAISTANLVKQIILGPPFCWRWNRAEAATFLTSAGNPDYQRTISDFGFIEKVSLVSGTETFEVPNVVGILSASTVQSRPEYVAAQLDNNVGAITIRFMNAPDKAYTTTITYQKKAALITSLSDTWSPIPDEYSFIYNQGFLAFSGLYADDQRSVLELQRFLGSLIGASQGLDESQKNAFIEGWLMTAGQGAASQARSQIGPTSRTSLR